VPKRDWRRAWNALRVLIEDPKKTEQVFEIIDSLSGGDFDRHYQRFTAHPEGRRLLAEKPSLLSALSDRSALRALPEGSFGRTYLEFMEKGGLSAEGLVEADEAAVRMSPTPPPVVDADRMYLGDRMRDMHDLWHVLTAYGMDEAGEAANLAFTLGQVPNLGMALIVAAAAVVGPKDLKLTWPRYLWAAYQRGRHTPMLSVARYEDLLPLPLEEVRRRLGVPPANEAHPEGIAVGSKTEGAETFTWQRGGVFAEA
jgi:ubiquinone biosynthesis protein COQ4